MSHPDQRLPGHTLAHGGGGRLTQKLIDWLFVPAFGAQPGGGHDGAMMPPRPSDRQDAGQPKAVSPSPPTPSSSARSSFPAATSARWRSTARSTIWRCAARGRWLLSAGFILEEGLPMEDALARRALDGRGRRRRPACRSSPATPRSSIAARATASSSTRPASAWSRRASTSRPQRVRPGDVILLSGDLAGTAWPSCRCARGWRSRRPSRATPRRWPAWWPSVLAAAGDGVHVPARSDPRRRCQRAERDRRPGGASASGWTKRASRSTRRCAARAKCWGSIRSTWPTKASAW